MVCGRGPSIGRSVKKSGKKLARELRRAAPDILSGGLTVIAREGVDYLTPDMPDINIDASTPESPMYVMPDSEEIRKARRRRGGASRGGRSSTILAGDSSETLGN